MRTPTLDLKGIPEPVARGLEVVAEMARQLAGVKPKATPRKRIPFASRKGIVLTPVEGGTVLTPLTREEIYADDDE